MLKYQRGITLVELMIAGTIGLIAVSAVITIYQATAASTIRQLETAHLYSTVQGIMDLIRGDLQRAGYWHLYPGKDKLRNNPFLSRRNDTRTGATKGEQADSCILFSYDLDRDGLVGIGRCKNKDCTDGTDADNVEQFGFRLRDAKLQSRYGGTEFGCRSGYWQTVNDPGIEITQLRFTEQRHCLNLRDNDRECRSSDPRLVQRAVAVQLHGQLRNKRDSEITLTQWVRIRNDQLGEGE